jgi:thiol-disulfide isomerase/thioredoxin
VKIFFSSVFVTLLCIGCSASSPATPPREKAPSSPPVKIYGVSESAMPAPELLEGESQADSGSDCSRKLLLGSTRGGIPVYLSEYAGKVLLVNFWASWCPPCWAEMPQLEALYGDYGHRGLAVVGVNFGEDDALIESFARRQVRPISFVIVKDRDGQSARAQEVSGVPTTLLFDTCGVMVKRYTGVFGFNSTEVRRDVEQLLKTVRKR